MRFDLALLTDGLKSEREQGITIDVAYHYFSTPRRRFIIADTPGHVQYTRNMVTGASTADLAVILVDARAGILTQTRRHGFIASLLQIPHVVVAINKMDLVDYSREIFENLCREYRAFTTKLDIHDLTFIPISALHGDNVVTRSGQMDWFKGPVFLDHLESVHIASDKNLIDFRFPVQHVLRPNSGFRGYSGTVASGTVRVGDEVTALPSGEQTRIERIVTYDHDLEIAFPPQSVTLCLAQDIDLTRGDMLVHPLNLPHRNSVLEAMLVWMDEAPLKLNQPYLIKHTTQTVRGCVTRLQYRINPDGLHREPAETLCLNEIGRTSLELYRPIHFDQFVRNRTTGSFIIIDPDTNATAGAAMIIQRRRQDTVRDLQLSDQPLSGNIHREHGLISRVDRQRRMRQRPLTVWLTGLSGSGKSSIARWLEMELFRRNYFCTVLDGDNVRHGLNRDLGFSAEDRSENIRRIAEVAALMNDAGMVVITSFISPYRADRERARQIIGPHRFLEIYLDTPLATCEERDPKGLYQKARSGEISSFTGISSPYEEPLRPDLVVRTAEQTLEELTRRVLEFLESRGIGSYEDPS